MSSRRHYSSTRSLYDTHSPRRSLHFINRGEAGEPAQLPDLWVAATPISSLTARCVFTGGSGHPGNSQAPGQNRLQHLLVQLTIRLRTVTWLPEGGGKHSRHLPAHIFIPAPQRTPVLRQESWIQVLPCEDLANTSRYHIRYFADDILIVKSGQS
jgi:hypothetical protein